MSFLVYPLLEPSRAAKNDIKSKSKNKVTPSATDTLSKDLSAVERRDPKTRINREPTRPSTAPNSRLLRTLLVTAMSTEGQVGVGVSTSSLAAGRMEMVAMLFASLPRPNPTPAGAVRRYSTVC